MKLNNWLFLVLISLGIVGAKAQTSYQPSQGILSDYPIGSYGFITAKNNNHFTQNAYFDGSWKSYGSSVSLGGAAAIQTNAIGGEALVVWVDNSIAGPNELLSPKTLLQLSNTGNLRINGGDVKMQIDGSYAGAISLKHTGFGSNPTFEWQSLEGRIRLNYTDDTIVRSDIFNVTSTGDVGIGTNPNTDDKLAVNGRIASKEIKVEIAPGTGPDYVFEEGYDLRSLEEVQSEIQEIGHLPEVPSAKEMESDGVDLGEMNMLLLKKIEELTLYLLEQNNKIKKLNAKVQSLEER